MLRTQAMYSLKSSWVSSALNLLMLVDGVQARFPTPLKDAGAQLKTDDDTVTFDPLGVAAVLGNPRADKSAVRLYTHYGRSLFLWPHFTMLGGTLPPMQMLVEHLTATFKHIHPAIKTCAKDTTPLAVRSDVSGNVFSQLPLNQNNFWLNDVVAFRTSENPAHDFAIVLVDGDDKSDEQRKSEVQLRIGGFWWRFGKWSLDLLSLINGSMLLVGMVFSVLTADIWGFTLFVIYICHWLASVLISLFAMVDTHEPKIKKDKTWKYAVYEREEGGTVIFKGYQETLERWARSTWEYKPSWKKECLHWLWVLTGTLSGIASCACMVNMRSDLQLGFLAVLIYSSLAEIVATRIGRTLQEKAHGEISKAEVLNKPSRTAAIIHATLGVIPGCRLTGLNWIEMRLLPAWPLFRDMQDLLKEIGVMQENGMILAGEYGPPDPPVNTVCTSFVDEYKGDPLHGLAKRIRDEIIGTLYPQYCEMGSEK
ncbi:hypothetical protein N7532_002215 [Penicillium argentinense]|uniref:Reticulon-like protein n=1 Tax=Penicillium argentinense TaxID=1131581 RepID=A0A9W9FZZ4_9EURO|nr:uncharacterized protein N7532_002215 [Penicillium argentinense]KAJ5109570.1 hypothetical protein N7532_002215 [Penicillium argentinense]